LGSENAFPRHSRFFYAKIRSDRFESDKNVDFSPRLAGDAPHIELAGHASAIKNDLNLICKS
jgi:hypothetical protein